MNVSIEIPVIRGGWLIQCIDSVLQQTSPNWYLTLYWDHGDDLSSELLEAIDALGHPRIQVFFGEKSLGIARARQFLSERSRGEIILPLDDDDVLLPEAVQSFITAAAEKPWASILRARRNFIDNKGEPILMNDWFPFARRTYINGATSDISNHSHPYAIRREALVAQGGWYGFEDFDFIGEDCSCFAKLEEVGEIELIDQSLYSYRIHQLRTSLQYTRPNADELWRRIADQAITRRQAPVERLNDQPPFQYRSQFRIPKSLEEIGFIIPFWETNEREIPYQSSRPVLNPQHIALAPGTSFYQTLPVLEAPINRIEIAFSAFEPVEGILSVAFFQGSRFSPSQEWNGKISAAKATAFEFVKLQPPDDKGDLRNITGIEISFQPNLDAITGNISLPVSNGPNGQEALIRFFETQPNFCRQRLEKGLHALAQAGFKERQIYLIEEPQSSAANRNQGFHISNEEWLCLLDDDAQIQGKASIITLLECMAEYNAGLCGPKLITPQGSIYSGTPYTDPLTQSARVAGLGEEDLGQYDYNCLVPWLPSTVMMIHRSVVLATGGFDERYIGSQHEDVDFCLRARSRGFNCCYAGKTMAVHDNMLRNGSFSKNMDFLKERWKDRQDLFVWPNLMLTT